MEMGSPPPEGGDAAAPGGEHADDPSGLAELLEREREALAAAEAARDLALEVLERVRDAFVALDREWRYQYVNARAEELLGRSAEELLGRSVWESFPEAVGTEIWHVLHRAVEAQEPRDVDLYFEPWQRWFTHRIYPSESGVSIYFGDITEAKAAGQEIERALERERAARSAAEDSARRLEALQSVVDISLRALSLDELVAELLRRVRRTLAVDAAMIFLVDDTGDALALGASEGIGGDPDLRVPLGTGFVGRVAASRRPAVVDNLGREDAPLPCAAVRSVAAVPLVSGDRLVGVLWVGSSAPRSFLDEDVRLLELVGERASVAIDRAEVERELRLQTEQLHVIAEIGRAAISGSGAPAIAAAAASGTRSLLDLDRVGVVALGGEGDAVVLAAAERAERAVEAGRRAPLGALGDLGRARRGEELVWEGSAAGADPLCPAPADVVAARAVPLLADGELLGLLCLSSREPGAPLTGEARGLVGDVANQLALALRQVALRERVSGHAEELELRVAERTAELREAYRRLDAGAADLRAAKEAAERANRAKSEFLSRMSHELRTPLNAILGFAQLLELEGLEPQQIERVDHILAGGRHLLGLIDEVLDIARIEAAELSLSLEPVDATEVVLEALALVGPLAAERAVALERPPFVPVHVLADRQRLKQVVLNLLSNAIKYNRRGGSVRVECTPGTMGRTTISVADTGRGIESSGLERLFEPFERLGAEATGVEGTGLGLALSRRLVEAMGGTIGAESIVGEGSTFRVELQGAEAPPERPGLAVAEPSARAGAPVAGTVLYIEDNVSNVRLLEAILALRPGVELIPAMQGRLGLELARKHRPDLVLLDLNLPDMSGDDVLRDLWADEATRGVPVVVLSADATRAQVRRLLGAGAREYLTKPFDIDRLLALVDEALASRQGLHS
jgi:PAS domain S-box-containing protein